MSNIKRKKKKQRHGWGIAAIIIVLVILAAVFLITENQKKSAVSKDENGQSEAATADVPSSESETEEPGLSFPYELDGGKLIVNSVFTSDIENPDSCDVYADDILSIELRNNSGQLLENTTIELTLVSGEKTTFRIELLPAGESVWAFSTDNTSCKDLRTEAVMLVNASYTEVDTDMQDVFEFQTDDTRVSITNISTQEKQDIKVYCHCSLEGVNYGGITYEYIIDAIPAGETESFEAEECFFGTPEIVRIECSN